MAVLQGAPAPSGALAVGGEKCGITRMGQEGSVKNYTATRKISRALQ